VKAGTRATKKNRVQECVDMSGVTIAVLVLTLLVSLALGVGVFVLLLPKSKERPSEEPSDRER
jgi:hypothetical protein